VYTSLTCVRVCVQKTKKMSDEVDENNTLYVNQLRLITSKDKDAVRALLDGDGFDYASKADDLPTPLLLAYSMKEYEIMEMILAKGTDWSTGNELAEAIMKQDVRGTALLLKYGVSCAPTVMCGKYHVLHFAVNQLMNVAQIPTFICDASDSQHIVLLLIRAGLLKHEPELDKLNILCFLAYISQDMVRILLETSCYDSCPKFINVFVNARVSAENNLPAQCVHNFFNAWYKHVTFTHLLIHKRKKTIV